MSILPPSMIEEQMMTWPELFAEDLPRVAGQECRMPEGIETVYAVGNGDSYHACLCAAADFSRRSSVRFVPMPAYSFLTVELPGITPEQAGKTMVICVSASGSSGLAVRILQEAGKAGLHTLAMTGRETCAMNDAAEIRFPAVIREKGRTPGLRTFAASYIGLLRTAELIGKKDLAEIRTREALACAAEEMPLWLEESRAAAERAAGWDWPCASVIGCGRMEGGAKFAAAKMTEGAGLFAVGEEMEEWCHVESMAYPLHAPLIILQSGERDAEQAVKAADTAHRAGRKVFLAGAGEKSAALESAADCSVFLGGKAAEELLPMLLTVPCAFLAQALAEKEGRGMFLSDQPIRLF